MIALERVSPANYEHLDRYGAMLDAARNIPEVADHLPEIFEEGSPHRIQEGFRNGAMRFFVIVEGVDVGRLELTRDLNFDRSIIPRTPKDIDLGFNTCYFVNPSLICRGLDAVHKVVADKSIREAFQQGDKLLESCPWLPVSLDGTDVSRGWLMQAGNPDYTVHGDEPAPGIFPQFGIGDNAYSIQYAQLRTAV